MFLAIISGADCSEADDIKWKAYQKYDIMLKLWTKTIITITTTIITASMAETTRVARDITGAAATTEEIITAAPAGIQEADRHFIS